MLLLHSVSYSGSWGQAELTLPEFVDRAADLGFDGVMLMAKRPHLSPLDFGRDEREKLREQMRARGLRGLVLAGYTNFSADLEHGEVPHHEIQALYVMELARLARDLGGSLVRVFTSYEHPAAGTMRQWNRLVLTLRECAVRASDFGVTLGVQNHHDVAVGYESLTDLLEAVDHPHCRAMFDAWAPALQGEDLALCAKRMAPWTVHTTVADYQLRPRFRYQPELVNYERLTPMTQAVPMGEGFIDYKGFLTAMRKHGFEGSVAYEMCSPLLGGGDVENLDQYARRFLAWTQRAPGSIQSHA